MYEDEKKNEDVKMSVHEPNRGSEGASIVRSLVGYFPCSCRRPQNLVHEERTERWQKGKFLSTCLSDCLSLSWGQHNLVTLSSSFFLVFSSSPNTLIGSLRFHLAQEAVKVEFLVILFLVPEISQFIQESLLALFSQCARGIDSIVFVNAEAIVFGVGGWRR